MSQARLYRVYLHQLWFSCTVPGQIVNPSQPPYRPALTQCLTIWVPSTLHFFSAFQFPPLAFLLLCTQPKRNTAAKHKDGN